MTLPKDIDSRPVERWSDEAKRLAIQAKSLSGEKLIELVSKMQRITGNTKDACWRFIRQHALRGKHDYKRWTQDEFERLREELATHSLSTVARKLGRSAESIRSILSRNGLSVRSIRCDLFSVESLAAALRVNRREVLSWIQNGWLDARVEERGKHRIYIVSPEALQHLYKAHLHELLSRGLPNRTLFEAYLQYCFAPKHTTGSQLLNVRRDKKERDAFRHSRGEEDEVG